MCGYKTPRSYSRKHSDCVVNFQNALYGQAFVPSTRTSGFREKLLNRLAGGRNEVTKKIRPFHLLWDRCLLIERRDQIDCKQ